MTATVVVSLTVSPRRHFDLDDLQPSASVPLWLLGLLGPHVCLGGLLLAPQAGKVRAGGERDLCIVVGQAFGQVGAVDGNDPLIRDDTGDSIVMAEDWAGDFLSRPCCADVVFKRFFAALFEVGKCSAKRLAAVRIDRVPSTCFIAGLDGSFVVSIDASIIRGLLMTIKSTSWP
ncbi:hypothetical protein [Mesorhizobium sp. M0976]|uniref:hypothetical protein n=1 Tax=Mesorhizobium sp. M0976 TaxID=2957038 RepID=UPI00333D08E5